ncbi:TonB-dependent receptor [Pseudoblastomonas halimionae]|uniref:TonB-dependent siderophore receptor n=1 Tax=Alteriqipengyuania halimionae TaxID=1926630 RepID=A0A6I4U456_9SPHN|nr:TonB-dependent siderophore receptor [Alteriqipengyuania halimionae]MXP10506.1 TonB-dependent siderophore receptor [Alteriqipengyuania halimionae]
MYLRAAASTLALTAMLASGAAHARDAEPSADAPAAQSGSDPDYAPGNLTILGKRDTYAEDDGSTATKTPTPLIDVPQTVNVLTEDLLNDLNATRLDQALRFVPGISLETGEGHRDEVFIRGQETSADFYLDGLRDDAQYYRPLYNIERVEVLKGPNALIFGRGGGGGVVNRVSKVANRGDAFTRLEGSVDSFGAFHGAVDANLPFGADSGARVNAIYQEFDSHRQFYGGRFIGIAPTATIGLGTGAALTLNYSYDDDERLTDRGVPSLGGRPIEGYDETLFGSREFNHAEVQAHNARARLDLELSPALTANASLKFADFDKVYANVVPSSATATTVTLGGYQDQTERRNWIGQGNLVYDIAGEGYELMLLGGVEAAWQDTRNGRNGIEFASATGPVSRVTIPLAQTLAIPAVSTTPLTRNRQSDLSTQSAYAQAQLDIGSAFEVIAGLRYDRFDLETTDLIGGGTIAREDEMVSPRAGVVYHPAEGVSLYASYAQSFLPQSGDQFYALSTTTAALEPEKFENIEVGAKWAPAADLFVTAAVFQLDRSNTRAADPADPAVTVPTGASRVRGVELSVAGELADRLQVNLGYTYLDGEITSDSDFAAAGTRLQQLPEHHVAAWARYDLTDNFGFGAGLIAQSDQYASFSNAVTLPGYARVDLAVFWNPTERLSLQANVENLFDETYYASAHGDNNIQPARPLNASVTARIRF